MKMRIFGAFMIVGICSLTTVEIAAKKLTIFENLVDVENYAKTLDEYPAIDNDNWESPDYRSFTETLIPRWSMRQLEKIGVRAGAWSATSFARLLKSVVKYRMNAGYQGRFAQKMNPPIASQFIIFGELNGAFHSLVRDLRSNVTEGNIDESFKILKNDCYIVIVGNALLRSPYLLETLTLIARLMYVNPERVIYIRGELEDKGRWEYYGLKQELLQRAAHISSEKIPLKDLIEKFLNTLPLALYLIDGQTEKTVDVVRISNYARDAKDLDEKNFAGALLDPTKRIFSVTEKQRSSSSVNVRAIIRGDPLLRAQQKISQGLVQYGKEEGATSWSLLSCPTGAYRSLVQFYFDAYVILTVYSSLDDWTLTLYNQDVRDMGGIRPVRVVKLVSGAELSSEKIEENRIKSLQEKLKKTVAEIGSIQKELASVPATSAVAMPAVIPVTAPAVPVAPAPAVVPAAVPVKPAPSIAPVAAPAVQAVSKPLGLSLLKEGPSVIPQKPTVETWAVPQSGDIVIGGIFDLSGAQREASRRYINGIEIAFEQANAAGGINGRNITLETEDDSLDVRIALEKVQKLRKKTSIIMGPMAWSVMIGILDLIKKEEIISAFPYMTTPAMRLPGLRYVLNYMVGTLQSFVPMIKYAQEKFDIKKLAILYPRTIEEKTIDMMMRMLSIKDYVKVSHDPNDSDFTEQIKLIDSQKPDSIALLTSPISAMNFVRQMKEKALDKVLLVDAFLGGGEFFGKFLRGKVARFIVSHAVPDPNDKGLKVFLKGTKEQLKLPIMDEYKDAAIKKNETTFNEVSFVGYISGKILVEILKRVSGVITLEKVISAAESISEMDLGGLPLAYDPLRHQFGRYAFFDTGSSEWLAVDVYTYQGPNYDEFLSAEDRAIKHTYEEAVAKRRAKSQPTSPIAAPAVPAVAPAVAPSPSGVPSGQITLGSTMDLSHIIKNMGIPLKLATEALFDSVNKSGGINGRSIEFIGRDDGYVAEKAAENVDYFINTLKIYTLLSPLGSPTLDAYFDKVKEGQLFMLFPVTGLKKFRSPDIKNIIHFRCSYEREAEALARYAVDTLRVKKIGLFYQKNVSPIADVLEFFKKSGFTNYFEIVYEEGSASFQEQIRTIIKEGPDALILLAIPTAALNLLNGLGARIRNIKILGWSDLAGAAFQNPWRLKGGELIISSVVPDPAAKLRDGSVYPTQLIQEFQKLAEDYSVPIGTMSFEGYINARIAIELYKQAGSDISREKIIKLAEEMKDFDLSGMKLSFNPQTRELYNTVWLDTGKGEWEKIVWDI